MQRDERKYLYDMLDAAQAIHGYAGGVTLDAFVQNRQLREAVYLNFVIIGEALSKLRRVNSVFPEQISEVQKIVGFRNQIVHGYTDLNHDVTWKVITSDLKVLIAQLEDMLKTA